MATRKKNSSGASPVRIFVRIGALKRFHALTQKTTDLPVTVSWDRRRGDRRDEAELPAGERRQSDRRQKPPFTWEVADFVVVEEPEAGPAKPRAKKR
jgi:hypothetical protein